MRCPSCGTENTPDSRFCGGCGARQPGSEPPRLAPTAKIPDDAAYPQPSGQPSARQVALPQGPVSYAPPSIPPPATSKAPVTPAPAALSTPPPGSLVRPQSPTPQPASAPPRAATRPQVSSASGSIDVPPRRPIGLMIALLVVDIGLAAAGAVLLSKGLADRPQTKSDPAPVEKKSQAPATAAHAIEQVASAAPAAPASAPTAGPASASPIASAVTSVAAREAPKRTQPIDPKLADKRPESTKVADAKVADKRPESAKVVDAKPADKPNDKPADKPIDKPADVTPGDATPVGRVPAESRDSHAAPNTEREIDAAAVDSKATFAECAADHPGHGAIKIAFQVRHDGRVINAAAVENTTGNAELARCLVAEISSWRVSAHNGTSINMLRPFTYP